MSRLFKIYISCPIALSDRVLSKYVEAAKVLGAEVHYWKRGTPYCEVSNIQSCDAFIVILPNEQFKYSARGIPNGCRLEIVEAQRSKKSIFIGYTTADDVARFYESDISSGVISGITRSFLTLPTAIKLKEDQTFASFLEFIGTNPVKKQSEIIPVIISVPYI